jgi:hypothetical protein
MYTLLSTFGKIQKLYTLGKFCMLSIFGKIKKFCILISTPKKSKKFYTKILHAFNIRKNQKILHSSFNSKNPKILHTLPIFNLYSFFFHLQSEPNQTNHFSTQFGDQKRGHYIDFLDLHVRTKAQKMAGKKQRKIPRVTLSVKKLT